MKKTLLFACLSAMVLMAACEKERTVASDAENSGNTVSLTVNVDYPEPLAGPSSKLSFNSSTMKMEWDGAEELLVFAGKIVRNQADDADSLIAKTFTLTGGTGDYKGVFSGALDFGDTGLGVEDIKAVALNGSTSLTTNTLELSSGVITIRLAGTQNITQSADNTFNGVYAAPYALVEQKNITEDGGSYTIGGLSLDYARPVIKFCVYDSSGAHSSDVLKSVQLYRSTTGTSPYGNTVINTSTGAVTHSSGQLFNNTKVTLSGNYTVPSTKAEALQLYLQLHRPRTDYKIEMVRIVINDGSQDITIVKYLSDVLGTLNLKSGILYNLGIDLADNSTTLEYSTDGGSTWETTLPTVSFSSLAVRTVTGVAPTYEVSGSALSDIKDAIDANGATTGIDLDLSGINVSSGILAAAFSGAKIKSVKLPANTVSLADNCFKGCTLLATVDLTGISALEIGDSVFYGCSALTSFDFSKAKSIAAHAFGEVPLTEVDLSAAQPGTTVAGYAFSPSNNGWNDNIQTIKVNNNVTLSSYAFFRQRGLSSLTLDAPTCTSAFTWMTTSFASHYNTQYHELTVTLGPHIKTATTAFWGNANVNKVIISDGALTTPAGTSSYNSMFGMCKLLKEIRVESTTAAPAISTTTFRYYDAAGTTANRATGYLVDASLKKLYVPSGTESFYNEENGGNWYTVVQQNLGYTLTTY